MSANQPLVEVKDLKEYFPVKSGVLNKLLLKAVDGVSFTIDKGSNDGISVDCNVMAGAGLCGIVTAVGPNWARVRAIIDDNSNVSAMISTTYRLEPSCAS